jgi:hypothetical protein
MQAVEIRVKEHLDAQWAEWLEGFSMTYTEQNETVLTGSITDQAALFGLIARLRDLGVKILAIRFGELSSSNNG